MTAHRGKAGGILRHVHTALLTVSTPTSSPSRRRLLGHLPLRKTPSRLLACPPGAPAGPTAFPLGALSAHHAAVCSSGLGEQVFPLFQPCASSGRCQHQSYRSIPLNISASCVEESAQATVDASEQHPYSLLIYL